MELMAGSDISHLSSCSLQCYRICILVANNPLITEHINVVQVMCTELPVCISLSTIVLNSRDW